MKLFKTLVISVLAVSLVLGIALPALANSKVATPQSLSAFKPDKEKEDREKGKVQVVSGNVTGISGKVITVNGKEITVTDDTKYKIPTLGKDATFADIQIGMRVVAQTRADDGKLYARQIVAVPGRPVYSRHTGNVTAYAYDPAAGGIISIKDETGNTITFTIIAGKFKVLPKGAEVIIGERVTVISHRDPAQSRLIATAVTVLPLPLKQITGVITAISENTDDATGTLTIGTTVLKYDANTLFALRGVGLRVKVGQQATVYYREQADHSLLAKRVLVGVKPPVTAKKAREVRPTAALRNQSST